MAVAFDKTPLCMHSNDKISHSLSLSFCVLYIISQKSIYIYIYN